MRRPLLIVTASGLAREVAAAARCDAGREIVGFVDDDPAQGGKVYAGVAVLGPLEHIADEPDCDVVVCAGRGAVRQALETRLLALGVDESRFATVVHPRAHVARDAVIGQGSVLLAGSVLTAAVTLGRHVVVMPNVTLTHDDVVADYATLCAGVTLGGNVHVGARTYVGMLAGVRENCVVGADAIIGMGAAVVGDVPAGQTWAGVPARPLRVAT